MKFSDGVNSLVSGRAIKRPMMAGYVKREMVTAAEEAPAYFDPEKVYTSGEKCTYNGAYFKCKATTTPGTLPTDTTKFDPYTLAPEEYKIVFVKRDGTAYNFFYNSESASATNLMLDKTLLDHILADDWIEGSSADFEEARDDSGGVW